MGKIEKDEDFLRRIAKMIRQPGKRIAYTINEEMVILHSLRGEFR